MKVKVREFTVNVQRDVLFEARVQADTIKEALDKAVAMSTEQLWATPGDILDDEHEITAVFG